MRSVNSHWRGVALASLVAALAAGSAAAAPVFDFGPVACRDRSLTGVDRLRAAGPFFESGRSATGSTFRAIRPFYASVWEAPEQRRLREVLWPLVTWKERSGQVDARILTAIYQDADSADPESHYRFRILPVWASGRDRQGETYRGLFPVAGSVHEFIGLDRVSWFLFPLYSTSAKNDLRTWNVLWPLVSGTTGGGVEKFRVFPLYGQSHWKGRVHKRFVLWPIWTDARYEAPESPGRAWALFPIVGRVDLENQKSWMVIPPLIRWSTGGTKRQGYVLWPLVQYSSGETDKFYLWPLWGWKRNAETRTSFFLWPIVMRSTSQRTGGSVDRSLVMPVYYRETRTEKTAEGERERARHVLVWPLVCDDRDGARRVTRLPALWPIRNTPPIERNFAPLWTVYAHRRDGDAVESEALWGLWRSRRDGEGTYRSLFPLVSWRAGGHDRGASEWSVLGGLIGRRRAGDAVSWRWLYVGRTGE